MSATSETSAATPSQPQPIGAVGFREWSAPQQRQIIIGLITAGAGLTLVIGGVAAFVMRIQIAAWWLGARSFFGTPLAQDDFWKVLIVAFHAVAFTGWGLLSIVAGCVVILDAFVRKQRKA